MKTKIQGVIFDFDGTLADSMWLWAKVDSVFLEKYGQVYNEDFAQMMRTLHFREAAQYTIDLCSLDLTVDEVIAEWFAFAEDFYRNEVQLKPGVASFLQWLQEKNIPTAIVTASVRRLVYPTLESQNIKEHFKAVITAEDVPVSKSEPDMYLAGAKVLGLEPENCLVFEDVLHGIRGAKKGGFPTVAVYDAAVEADWPLMMQEADQALYEGFQNYEKDLISWFNRVGG